MDDSFSGDLGCTIGRGLERERTLDRLKRKRKTPLPENMVVVFFFITPSVSTNTFTSNNSLFQFSYFYFSCWVVGLSVSIVKMFFA